MERIRFFEGASKIRGGKVVRLGEEEVRLGGGRGKIGGRKR